MKIHQNSTFQNILDQFSILFPYLKLEIYGKSHKDEEGSKSEDQLSHLTLLSEINPSLSEKEFNLDHEMSVSDFEKMIENELSLHVQVFRKSNSIWLQTTATDHWSLKKQNKKGQNSTIDYKIEPIDITDFDVE